jgi:hypothetical protein
VSNRKSKIVTKANPYSSKLKALSRFISQDFLPDGNLDKSIWREAERVRLDHDWAGRKSPAEIETRVSSLWTSTHVHFAFWCRYSVLSIYEGEDAARERWGLWHRDVVEVFLNPEPERVNHYYEFEVAPNNQWIDLEIDLDKKPFNDPAWNSGFEHATRVLPEQHLWTCELSIPVASMNIERLRPDVEWRINFYRAEGLGDDTKRRFLCWSPVLGERPNFHQPTRFGMIRFESQ